MGDRSSWASPPGIDGRATLGADADAARSAFAEAERRLFSRYGLDVEECYLDLAAPRLRTRVLIAGSGPPVLMLHGGGGCASNWTPLMPELAGYRLIAPDRPGCGLSDGFTYRGVSLRRHAEGFIGSVLDRLGLERVAVVANSMGALWALWYALKEPERIGALALLGCPATLLGTGVPPAMRLMAIPGLNFRLVGLQKPGRRSTESVFRIMGHTRAALDRQPKEFWEIGERMVSLPSYYPGFLTLIENVMHPVWGPRSELGQDELRRVTQPVLFVWGGGDTFGSPAVGRRAVQVMPDARLEVVAAGHLPWIDEPAACGSSVRAFLREHRLAAWGGS